MSVAKSTRFIPNTKIHAVSFYVLGSYDVRDNSFVTVSNKEGMKNGSPVPDGMFDSRMGTTEFNLSCQTCNNGKNKCPGHFGLIELRYPVKSPMFRDEILKWLKIICHNCGNIVSKTNLTGTLDKRLGDAIKMFKSVTKCEHCGHPCYPVAKDKLKTYMFYRTRTEGVKTIREEIMNHHIKAIFDKIPNEVVTKLGKPEHCHPSKYILSAVPVPPNTMRPDMSKVGSQRASSSDINTLLRNLFEVNNTLPDEIPPDSQILQSTRDDYGNLDMIYYALIKGDGGGDTKVVASSSAQLMSICKGWGKKQGRIRKNLMGKRVEYMIRSVITGDPRLKVNEVGVPIAHARNLEIPERVTQRNIEEMRKYFNNGVNIYPGCRHIRKTDGRLYKRDRCNDHQLVVGDTIMRDMITGDYLCFNRQPSLLFSNIAGMRVVVMESGDTLRLNPSVCNYFNADFDGDQMNSIVSQDIMAIVECKTISAVPRWLISPQNHAPLVGGFQDGLIGIAEFTKAGLKFDKWHAMQMFGEINTPTINYTFNAPKYTNREIVSMILPKINVSGKSPSFYKPQYAQYLKYNPEDINVEIRRGVLQSGMLDKATVGQSVSGSIIHVIANEYGNSTALETVYNLQQIVHRFFGYQGFTVGIEDININEDAMREIKNNIATMIMESRKITQRLASGKLIAPLGTTLRDHYETEQLNALTAGDDFVVPILKAVDANYNQMFRLIMVGSKGKLTNFVSINGAVGSQTINGARFPAQAGWGRTLPYFTRYDMEPEASGYVSQSFREGVSSKVYTFMAGEARHGLISNALSTSVTGTQNRVAIKNLEGIIANNVRASVKGSNVDQILYADCGLDPTKLEKVKFPTIMISDDDFDAQYHSTMKKLANAKPCDDKLLESEFQQLKGDRALFRKLYMTLEAHNPKEYIMDVSKFMPINVLRIIDDTIYNYQDTISKLSDEQKIFDPAYVIIRVNEFCDDLGYVYSNDIQRQKKAPIPAHIRTATILIQILIRSYLNTSTLYKKNVCPHTLNIILDKITTTYQKSLIEYGTSIGFLSVQCVCEQFTQYILDSKHRTGGQGGTKTNAIERIKEILNGKVTEKMIMPHMLIMVRPEYEHDKVQVENIANNIEMMEFKRFVATTHILYEEYGKPRHPRFAHEAKMFELFERHNAGMKIPGDLAKWCIRYTLNREELLMKSMTLETIVIAIRKALPKVFIVHNSENDDIVTLRIFVRMSQVKHTGARYVEDVLMPLNTAIKSVVVRGVRNIIGTFVVEVMRHEIQPNGALEMKKCFAISASGTNMPEIINLPQIDPYRTQSDSIDEMQKIYGICVARNKIINELMATLSDLNRIHCTVFADEMCYTGQISNIQRTGLQKRENANVTLRISFQTPTQVIQNAAIHGMVDVVGGVSGPIVMGSVPNIGTTYNQIVVNERFIKERAKRSVAALDEI